MTSSPGRSWMTPPKRSCWSRKPRRHRLHSCQSYWRKAVSWPQMQDWYVEGTYCVMPTAPSSPVNVFTSAGPPIFISSFVEFRNYLLILYFILFLWLLLCCGLFCQLPKALSHFFVQINCIVTCLFFYLKSWQAPWCVCRFLTLDRVRMWTAVFR